MPYSNHTSNRWLVYITVQTTCKMRLYNDRLRDGSQCKHSVASGSAPLWLVVSGLSWWWLCSVRVWLSVTFSMRSRHSALSIQSMASHWIPSLWRQTPTQTDTPCIHKHQQPGRHNGSIIQCEHVMKWAMSRLLAYCTRKQLAAGESEAFPNVWQFAGMITKRLNPHPHLCLRCLLFPLYASMYDVKLCKGFWPVVLQLLQGEDVLIEVLLEFLVCVVDIELFKPVHLHNGRTCFQYTLRDLNQIKAHTHQPPYLVNLFNGLLAHVSNESITWQLLVHLSM